MLLIYLLGLVAWAVPTAAGIWYLLAFRDMHAEIKLIRRYLQSQHERAEAGGRPRL